MNEPSNPVPPPTPYGLLNLSEDKLAPLRAQVARLNQELTYQKRMTEELKSLASPTSPSTGYEFLQLLAERLSELLNVRYVCVSEWSSRLKDKVRIVAGWFDGRAADPIEYDLSGTPCSNVFRKGNAYYPRNVQQLFPDDKFLSIHNIESYMGTLLSNNVGQPIGHLCIMNIRPLPFDIAHGHAILEVYGARMAAEMMRAMMEAGLRRSEERLNRFVANAPVGLVILGKNKRVICANKALCQLTGYSEEEIIGKTYELYTHPHDLAANLALTDEFYRGLRSEYTYEKRYIRKSGEIIWVSVKATGVELPEHQGPLLLAVVQDVTEQKLAAEEREQLSRDLHDNILQSLYAVGMQLEAGKMATRQSSRRLHTHINTAIDHLNRLMIEVRQFIALLTQRTTPRYDLKLAMRLLVASLSTGRHVAPKLHIQNSTLRLLLPEEGEQLLNIAREALSNSVRHSEATSCMVRLTHNKQGIRLAIEDDGIGISTSRPPLHSHGLSNMAARARKIHAYFKIESTPGKGTRVIVKLPSDRATSHA